RRYGAFPWVGMPTSTTAASRDGVVFIPPSPSLGEASSPNGQLWAHDHTVDARPSIRKRIGHSPSSAQQMYECEDQDADPGGLDEHRGEQDPGIDGVGQQAPATARFDL